MMTPFNPNATFKRLIDTMGKVLRSHGYRRRGSVFTVMGTGTCGLIGFQRSVANSPEGIRFTVNLAIVCGDLTEGGPTGLKNASTAEAHLQQRIGLLLPEARDKWWELTEATDFDLMTRELETALLTYALPYIAQSRRSTQRGSKMSTAPRIDDDCPKQT